MAVSASSRIIEVRFTSAQELEGAFKEQISKGGYFIKSDDPAPRTTPVEIRFYLPGVNEPLSLAGEVAFAAPLSAPMPGMGAGMAIQFHKLNPQTLKTFEASITIARSEGLAPETKAGKTPEPGASEEPIALGGEEPAGDSAEPTDGDENSEGEDELDEAITPQEEEDADKILAHLNLQSSENLYAIIRKMPPHQKIVAAKRGNRAVRNILLQEGNKKIMTFLLQNPQMSAGEIIQMLKMTNLSQEIVQAIAKNSNWSQSDEVKAGIVTHPKTPLPLALTLLPGLNQNSLAKLAKSQATKHQIKSNALKLLEQRRKSG